MVLDIVNYTFHTFFAALWAGSTLFFAIAVVPAVSEADFEPVLGRFLWITRVSVLITLVTGGHLAGTLYTADTLTGTTPGYLVLAMLVLWLALAAIIEMGAAKAKRSNTPATTFSTFLAGGALVAIGLLVVAGLLGANRMVGL